MPIKMFGLDERERSAKNQQVQMGMTGLGHTFQASIEQTHDADDGANLGMDLNTLSVKTPNEDQKHLQNAQSSRRIIQLSNNENRNFVESDQDYKSIDINSESMVLSEKPIAVNPDLILEDGRDPLRADDFDRKSLFKSQSSNEKKTHESRKQGQKMEILSRKDRDAFFDSLGGWNEDDLLGSKA